jgi:hypothetical protein
MAHFLSFRKFEKVLGQVSTLFITKTISHHFIITVRFSAGALQDKTFLSLYLLIIVAAANFYSYNLLFLA